MNEHPAPQTPPSEVDAERTVLGAVIIDNAAFNDAAELLRADDFYREAHRRIFRGMAALFEKGEPIDLVTLRAQLTKEQDLDAAGGVAYLAGLTDGMPRLENVVPWCRLIVEASGLRALIHASRRVEQFAYEHEGTLAQVLDRAEHQIFALADRHIRGGSLVTVSSLTRDVLHRLEQEHEGLVELGLSTGFVDIDRIVGGLKAPDLVVLAARPGMGKTSLALQIAQAVAATRPVAFFSLEMSRDQLVRRLIFIEARVDSARHRMRLLEQRDWERMASSHATFARSRMSIDDTSSLTPLELRAKCRRMKARDGLALVVVDYLQLMTLGESVENRQVEIATIARDLKKLAKDMDVPVLALSQLNRASEGRADKEPQLSDLRESGAIEQDADAVMFIHRPELAKPSPENAGLARVIFAKNRFGPQSVAELAFVPDYTRFEQLSRAFEDPLSGEEDE